MNKTVLLQRQARQLWRDGRFQDAAEEYRRAAETCSGFARDTNLRCAEDCDNRKPFEGITPAEATYLAKPLPSGGYLYCDRSGLFWVDDTMVRSPHTMGEVDALCRAVGA